MPALYQFHNQLLPPNSHFGFTKTFSNFLTAQTRVATLWLSASSITKHEHREVGEVIGTNLELVSASKRQIQRYLVILGGNEINKVRWSELLSDEAIDTTYSAVKITWLTHQGIHSNAATQLLLKLLGRAECIIDLLKAIDDLTASTCYLPVILKQLDLLALDNLVELFFLDVGVQDDIALKRTKISPRALQSEMGYYHEVVQQQQQSARDHSHFISLRNLGHLSFEQEMDIMHYLHHPPRDELSQIFDRAKLLNCRLLLPKALPQKTSPPLESNKSTSSTLIYRDDNSISEFDNARSDSENVAPIINHRSISAFFKVRSTPLLAPHPSPQSSEDSLFQSTL